MKKLFTSPEVNAFEFSPSDAIMVSGPDQKNSFAVDDGKVVPTITVEDPAAADNTWN